MPRVVLVSTALNSPLVYRRARAFLDAGYKVRVYGFERVIGPIPPAPTGVDVVTLGTLPSRRYVSRIWHLVRAVLYIRQLERNVDTRPVLTYSFGLDALFVATYSFGTKVERVYEIADLRNAEPDKTPFSRMLYCVEATLVSGVKRLIVTSPRFLDGYYERMVPDVSNRALVLENKLPKSHRLGNRRRLRRATWPIKIGVIGLFRYARALLPALEAVASRADKFEMHFFGDGPLRPEIERYASENTNIRYHGKFKTPNDLEKIYSSIDLSFVVYDNTDRNVQLALPNKLYEAIYFGVPIVVASNTELAKRTRELKLGYVVDPQNQEYMVEFLNQLNPDEIEQISRTILELPEEYAVFDDTLLPILLEVVPISK